MTDYQNDLARIEGDIQSVLVAHAIAPAALSPEAGNISRLYFRRFQLASPRSMKRSPPHRSPQTSGFSRPT
jgi:hypothetical protein